MTQTEAVILSLHMLGGRAQLQHITLLALSFKDADWSQTLTPDSSIRRIVRNTPKYIVPVDPDSRTGWYRLIADCPEELLTHTDLVPDYVMRISKPAKLDQFITQLLAKNTENEEKIAVLEDYLESHEMQILMALSLDAIVDYCLTKVTWDEARYIRTMLLDLLSPVMTAEDKETINRIKPYEKKGITINGGANIGNYYEH